MLYLLRHGNLLYPAGGKRYIGRTDLPLSPEGIREAGAWQRALADIAFDRVVCSEAERCLHTARLVAGERPLSITADARLNEIDLGEWDGQLISDIQHRYPEQWAKRGERPAAFRPPGGESFGDLQQRLQPFVEAIGCDSRSSVLAVTHAGVIRTLLCTYLSIPLDHLFRFHVPEAALSVIDTMRQPARVIAVNLDSQSVIPAQTSQT